MLKISAQHLSFLIFYQFAMQYDPTINHHPSASYTGCCIIEQTVLSKGRSSCPFWYRGIFCQEWHLSHSSVVLIKMVYISISSFLFLFKYQKYFVWRTSIPMLWKLIVLIHMDKRSIMRLSKSLLLFENNFFFFLFMAFIAIFHWNNNSLMSAVYLLSLSSFWGRRNEYQCTGVITIRGNLHQSGDPSRTVLLANETYSQPHAPLWHKRNGKIII